MTYAVGHRGSPAQRFWAKVDKTETCWLWTATTNGKSGYGTFTVSPERRRVLAHRFAYELMVGGIPEGMHIDHLCRIRLCVNPAHLEAVTPRENTLRGVSLWAKESKRTHCPQGHPYEGSNLLIDGGKRKCRECVRAYHRRRYARQKAAS